ncbi:MAG: dihydroceramide fatty acyl 2-hydroxylase [Myxococcota bacterium]|jgi:dihydroceramide fatty acyl 2-hydroxylase
MGLFDTTQEWKDALDAWTGIEDKPPVKYRTRSKGFKVLENDILENWFATSHWAMPGLWFIPVVLGCAWLSHSSEGLEPAITAALIGAGVLGWTLVEYLLHRWLFHLAPSNVRWIKEIQYTMHGYHHEFPDDPGRLVAPPILSWPLAMILAGAYWTVFGSWAPALFAGTVAGYLAYDWMHYYTHHAIPKNRVGKFMRKFHIEHHFRIAESQFGLSSPLWDYLFGTFWTTRAFKHTRHPDSSATPSGQPEAK